MKITIKARHMDVTDSIREYAQTKAAKLERFYDRLQTAEVILDRQGDQAVAEVVASAMKKHTFVATQRGPDLYACLDQCLAKVEEQIRRHKDKVRDRQGPPHSESMGSGG